MQILLPHLIDIINYATKYYYSKILLWAVLLIATYSCIRKINDAPIYQTLLAYLTIELTLGVTDNFISPNQHISDVARSYYINISNIVVALLEFHFFSQLHFKSLNKNSKRLYKIFFGTLLAFAVSIIIYSFMNNGATLLKLTYLLGCIEFIFLFYLSITFFLSLIKNIPASNLFDKGSFWCFLGALFYCSISAPFYIVGPEFPTGIKSFDTVLPAVMYYLPFLILFICILKGLTCKTPIWS